MSTDSNIDAAGRSPGRSRATSRPMKGVVTTSTDTEIDEELRGSGLGTLMYERALLDLAEHKLAMAPHDCAEWVTVSDDAKKVWRKLKLKYPHEGALVVGEQVASTMTQSVALNAVQTRDNTLHRRLEYNGLPPEVDQALQALGDTRWYAGPRKIR